MSFEWIQAHLQKFACAFRLHFGPSVGHFWRCSVFGPNFFYRPSQVSPPKEWSLKDLKNPKPYPLNECTQRETCITPNTVCHHACPPPMLRLTRAQKGVMCNL